MPRIDQMIQVKIVDNGGNDGRRQFTAEIDAPAKIFMISDMLANQKLLASVQKHISKAIRYAISDYVKTGREIIETATDYMPENDKVRRRCAGQDKRTAIQRG